MYYNKHYIRTRADGCITHWYTDAFEQSQEGDICINEQGGRQRELNGEINPSYLDINMIPLYYWDGEIKPRTQEDIQAEIDALPQGEAPDEYATKTEVNELREALEIAMEGLTDE